MEYEVVKLEDNIDYLLLKEQLIDNINYLYLVNSNNSEDFVIRKEINDEYIGLDSEEEFNKVITYFLDMMVNDNE